MDESDVCMDVFYKNGFGVWCLNRCCFLFILAVFWCLYGCCLFQQCFVFVWVLFMCNVFGVCTDVFLVFI